MKEFLKKQWSRKIAWGFAIEMIGTIMFILSVYKIFPKEITFDKWANFTEWLTAFVFAANVGDKVFTKPTGQIFDNDAPKQQPGA